MTSNGLNMVAASPCAPLILTTNQLQMEQTVQPRKRVKLCIGTGVMEASFHEGIYSLF